MCLKGPKSSVGSIALFLEIPEGKSISMSERMDLINSGGHWHCPAYGPSLQDETTSLQLLFLTFHVFL